jgi:hypothetical protein
MRRERPIGHLSIEIRIRPLWFDFSKEASSMEMSKSMAVAVSGLVFAGGAALTVGAAGPASAQAVTAAAPQQLVADGCCGRGHHRWHGHHRNHWRQHQRIIVINRNNNFSKSDNDRFHRGKGKEEDRNFSAQPD